MTIQLFVTLEEAVLLRAILRDGWVRHVHPEYLKHSTEEWRAIHAGLQADADAMLAKLEACLP